MACQEPLRKAIEEGFEAAAGAGRWASSRRGQPDSEKRGTPALLTSASSLPFASRSRAKSTSRAIDGTAELTAISHGLVALLKEYYGRGPTQAKSYYRDDPVVCVLRGGFTRVEETLRDGGRGDVMCEVFILDPTDLVE